MAPIVLFDGECHFCDKSVQFIITRDPTGYFKFASLQSNIGRQLLNQYNVPQDIDSLVLLDNNTYYLKSTAALRICSKLTGGWKFASVCFIIPKRIRDICYDSFAKNRYQWFGKKHECMLPTKKQRGRFL
ncbi:thiol-disulfide oxidoreductase DCC family protein [Aquibacillus salsiterrae]|uniref:Thiol-disulfide oxidoreductase DCC family protein n=1 Tax=Aquibacillus salsiterrae TaxID=2950439 RepID=A0A9X4AFD3_9BACI|nr:thiol-disulfide oxidoreductase DCC family protein [Aquibacillus salsiterrae]MDC3416110.1 thiol-disulfide oxidoreductase DCC family protein [Aquibacillus salsiterrae]